MDRVSEGWKNFNSAEAAIYKRLCAEGAKELGKWLEQRDDELSESRDKSKYRLISKRHGTVKTVMGEVSYKRRYYRERGESKTRYVYLLDEAMGFEERPGLLSEALEEMVLDECMDKSFRKASRSVSRMTGQTISAGGAWNVVQANGARLERDEERLVELNESGALRGEVVARALFTEADGLWLPMQGPRSDAPEPARRRKRELKIATMYSGWRETASGRYETVGKVACAGFEGAEEFAKKREAMLALHYDADAIEARVINGDGAAWVRKADEGAVMQLDPFHRSRSIIRGLPKAQAGKAFRLLAKKDVDGLLDYVGLVAASADDEAVSAKARKLHQYLSGNKDCLLTWKERGVALPEPPEGVIYRQLGTQEHANFYIVGKRMKRRGMSWSDRGGGHMAKLLCGRVSGGFVVPDAGVACAAAHGPALSASQAPVADGNGHCGGAAHGGWPFEGAASTNGRDAVRGILRLKPASQLAYK
jgi:hypothetical protein